jgi:CRISPR/Cas system-associated protein endoribonuclease Cas2
MKIKEKQTRMTLCNKRKQNPIYQMLLAETRKLKKKNKHFKMTPDSSGNMRTLKLELQAYAREKLLNHIKLSSKAKAAAKAREILRLS